MSEGDLDTLVIALGQSLEQAKRIRSKVIVHLIRMAVLELANMQMKQETKKKDRSARN